MRYVPHEQLSNAVIHDGAECRGDAAPLVATNTKHTTCELNLTNDKLQGYVAQKKYERSEFTYSPVFARFVKFTCL